VQQVVHNHNEAAAAGLAAQLSRLPSLRELELQGDMPEAVAQGVTQLTSLTIDDGPSEFSTLCNFAHQFCQLQHLNISPDPDGVIPCLSQELRGLLLALTQLQSLEMSAAPDQQGLDAVLEHGKHLTRLTVTEINLTESRANAASILKALQWEGLASIEPWAYLPLHSMDTVTIKSHRFDEHQLPGKEWWLPVQCRGSSDPLPSLMARAVSNILRCPLWAASGTGLAICLISGSDNDLWNTDEDGVGHKVASYSSSTRLGAIRAPAPLMPRVSHFSILMPGFTLGGPEVAALGEVGGPHITHLTIEAGDLSSDFWPAV
jgi:hypothetical protein